MHIESKLAELGLELPAPAQPPPGFDFQFEWVRVRGNRLYVSGHGALALDGSPSGPFGSVPSEVALDSATDAARECALSILSSVSRAIGDLDRITAWLTVSGHVNADNGFTETTTVLNGFSDFVNGLFGPKIGAHARTAIGVASLPLNNCVVVSAELEFDT